jgi:hypothetical protein
MVVDPINESNEGIKLLSIIEISNFHSFGKTQSKSYILKNLGFKSPSTEFSLSLKYLFYSALLSPI